MALPLLLAAALLALPATAPAQSRTGLGSPLTAAPNYPYHCDYRWSAGYGGQPGAFGPGGYQEYTPTLIGASDCALWHLGMNGKPETSHLVPGTGTVTVARVKSGPNPAPISIATIRSYEGRDQQGMLVSTCCQGVSETQTITPTPNAVTEIPVNFRVEAQAFDPNTNRAGFHDIVAVNVHGTSGTLPLHDKGGPKPFTASPTPTDDFGIFWHFPQVDPSQHNQNRWSAPGFEVLMNYDWCPAPPAGRARQAQAACATQGGGQTPLDPPPADQQQQQQEQTPDGKPASIESSRLTLLGSKVAMRVSCAAAQTCSGRLSLKTRGRKARTLATKRIAIPAGKSSKVKVRLSKRNRRRVKGSGLPVTVVVDLGAGGKVTRKLTLRRAG